MKLRPTASLSLRVPLLAVWLVMASLTGTRSALASTITMSYSGRLTQPNGAPLEGTVPMEARFWSYGLDGTQLGPTLDFPAVDLINGLFIIDLVFSSNDAGAMFGGGGDEPVFIEITANGKVYPRQKFSYVPYALRIPVDEQTIKFGTDGKLTLAVGAASGTNQFLTKDGSGKLTWGTPLVTKLQNQTISAATPSSGQVLRYDGSQWVAANQSTDGNAVNGTLPVTNGGTGVTSFTNNGVVIGSSGALSATAAGSQYNILVAGSGGQPGFGQVNLAASAAVSGTLGAANGGTGSNLLPSNSVLLGNGADPLQAVAPGASGNVLTSNGTTWQSSSIPAPNWGSPGAGKVLTSDADGLASWTLPAARGVTSVSTGTGLSGGPITDTGTISLADTNVSPGAYTRANITVDQQGRLTAAASAPAIVDADIAAGAAIAQSKVSGLATSLAAKENSIAAGTTSQYFRGDKSWQELTTTAVAEGGTNLYYTDARARSALSATGPITYGVMDGTIGIAQASGSSNGYMSSADWSTFNGKQNALGYTPINKAGDTMSGALNSGGFDITNTGNIQMAASKTLSLSANASDPAGLGTNDKGKTWYNATTNQIKYWDGSNVITLGTAGSGLTSLNGLSGNTQTFGTPGSSGTAPAWSSASNVHTLSIPLASAAGVTAGLLSNADYSAFNNKVNAVTQGTGIAVATASGTATVTLANTAVTPGTYTRTNITVDQQGRLTAAANGGNVNLASEVIGVLPAANGGTGATTKSGAFDALSPMNAAGDLVYGGTSGTGTKLAGNTTSTKQFLSSTGNGTAANAPAWAALTAADLPAHSAALITSGTLGVANGGTGTGSTNANYVFAGPTSGSGAPSFRALVAGDYPAMVGANGTTAGSAGAVPGPAASDNVKFLRGDGTWSTPAAAAAGATNQIQYNSSGVLTGNANFVYSGGNVGIGTTAPGAKLDVNGTIRVPEICDESGSNCKDISLGWGSASSEAIFFSCSNAQSANSSNLPCSGAASNGGRGNSTYRAISCNYDTGNYTVNFLTWTGSAWQFYSGGWFNCTDNTVRVMKMDATGGSYTTQWSAATGGINYASGNVGIGTTAPAGLLDVVGTGGVFLNAGNVGIGVNSLPAKLSIAGGDGTNLFTRGTITLGFGANGSFPHTIHTRHQNSGSGNAIDFYTNDGSGNSYPSGSVHNLSMVNGNVGIGTTAPSGSLDVRGHFISTTGSPPTLSSCGAGSISGTDNSFKVTTGSVTTCTINFGVAWAVAPSSCTITPGNSAAAGVVMVAGYGLWISTLSTTQMAFSSGTAMGGGVFYIQCF